MDNHYNKLNISYLSKVRKKLTRRMLSYLYGHVAVGGFHRTTQLLDSGQILYLYKQGVIPLFGLQVLDHDFLQGFLTLVQNLVAGFQVKFRLSGHGLLALDSKFSGYAPLVVGRENTGKELVFDQGLQLDEGKAIEVGSELGQVIHTRLLLSQDFLTIQDSHSPQHEFIV